MAHCSRVPGHPVWVARRIERRTGVPAVGHARPLQTNATSCIVCVCICVCACVQQCFGMNHQKSEFTNTMDGMANRALASKQHLGGLETGVRRPRRMSLSSAFHSL